MFRESPPYKMVFYQRNKDTLRPSRRICNLAVTIAAVTVLLYITYKLQLCKLLLLGLGVLPDDTRQTIPYDRNMPLIFISSVPRSGAGLLRVLLDAHPEVRCSDDMHMISLMIDMTKRWPDSEKEKIHLEESGVDENVIHAAMAAFCLEVFAREGRAAPRLCYKDPVMLLSADYMVSLFPQAKFIFLVRDGRATVNSAISQEMPVSSVNTSYYRQYMSSWNKTVSDMYVQCQKLGKEQCLLVYYEQLVLHPEQSMRKISSFLNLTWDENVLHSGSNQGLQSFLTRNISSVKSSVHINSLTKWVGNIPKEIVEEMETLAPMLATLGYDPRGNPPNYGTPDALSHDSKPIIRDQVLFW